MSISAASLTGKKKWRNSHMSITHPLLPLEALEGRKTRSLEAYMQEVKERNK